MKLNKLREAMIRKVQGILRTRSELIREHWFIFMMLISAVLAVMGIPTSSNLYKTTLRYSKTFSLVVPIMKNAVTFSITLLLFILVPLAIYFTGVVYGLVKKIEGMNPLSNKPHYKLNYYIVSFALSSLFFLGLFDTLFNVAPYLQAMLIFFILLLNASHVTAIHVSLSPYFQLILTGVVISMSIITSYAWKITTPTPGMHWSNEVREIMRSVRNVAFLSYIAVLILLFLLWPYSSIDVSYELSYQNSTPVLLTSASFPMIPIISFGFAIIIAIVTTAIYGIYFAKVLLDAIYSQNPSINPQHFINHLNVS
jgi:hypothetical protein